MAEEETPALDVAGDEDVSEEITHGTPEDEGQDESQPAEKGETTDGEPDDGKPDEDDEKSRSKERRERRKAHIAQLKQEARDAREYRERLKRAAESEVAPKEADFDDLTEYAIAKAAWSINAKQTARNDSEAVERERRAEQARRQQVVEDYQEQAREARKTYEDFDKVVSNPAVKITPDLAELIYESEKSAEVAYHVASRPDLASRLSEMDAVQASRELGRIEAQLSLPRARTETNAPPPLKPVGARSSAARSPESMSFAEYRAWREGK